MRSADRQQRSTAVIIDLTEGKGGAGGVSISAAGRQCKRGRSRRGLPAAPCGRQGIRRPKGVSGPVDCPASPPKLRSLSVPLPVRTVMSLGSSVSAIFTYMDLPIASMIR